MRVIRRIGQERRNHRVSLPRPWADGQGVTAGTVLALRAEVGGREEIFHARVISRAGGLYITVPRAVRRAWGLTHGSPLWLLMEGPGTVNLQPVRGASLKELERLGLYEYRDRIRQEQRRAEAYLAALQSRGAAALRSSAAGRGIRRNALARLARENRALQEELRRLRRVLAGDREPKAP